jgi:S-ribosylhomocysteine lyase LuxS involved in autoinducer biosynthesis
VNIILEVAKETCSDVDNVEFINADVYDETFKIPNVDIVHIDAGHTYEHVVYDIDRCIEQMNNPIIIMDDYGHEGRTVEML